MVASLFSNFLLLVSCDLDASLILLVGGAVGSVKVVGIACLDKMWWITGRLNASVFPEPCRYKMISNINVYISYCVPQHVPLPLCPIFGLLVFICTNGFLLPIMLASNIATVRVM